MRIICYLLSVLALLSCSSKKIAGRNLKTIGKDFRMEYADGSHSKDTNAWAISLSEIFKLDNPEKKPITIGFDASGDLKVSCTNALGGENFRAFKGKSTKRGYEIYFEKKRIPFAPVYSVTQIDRVRVRITHDSTLVVDRYYNHTAMIALMAGGHSSKRQYQFKKIR